MAQLLALSVASIEIPMLSQCMSLKRVGEPLRLEEREIPAPGPGQVLLRVRACAVCRTDLHVIDGELKDLRLPIVPGHEIVGEVVQAGAGVELRPGARLGVPWLGYACGACEFCLSERENLCDSARFTGYQIDGGYAEHVLADARFCFALPDSFDDLHAAPLLCAGVIGYRCLRMAGDAHRIGIFGFGAAAHIIAQVAQWQGREIYAFTRPGDDAAQAFARECGARWTGDSNATPPQALDAALIFAPVGDLVPAALRAVRKGGVVVCGGIHMSDIPAFPYSLLWGERVVRSVANLTRRDAREFLEIAPNVPVRTHVERFSLAQANMALARLRAGQLTGAAVLVP
jgi:alcohol dehydrogenase, propanol-preferring